MIYRSYILFISFIGLLLIIHACANDSDKNKPIKQQSIYLDFTVDGNDTVISDNHYAGTPSIEDKEKVFSIEQGKNVVLVANVGPKSRIKKVEWYINDDEIPFASGSFTHYSFSEKGLIKLFLCINEQTRCISKYVNIEKKTNENIVDNGMSLSNVENDIDENDKELDIRSDKKSTTDIKETYVPPLKPDSDNDGITDDKDKCPYKKGVLKYNGCPLPDRDQDGIADNLDNCPNEKGVKEYNGCPPPTPPCNLTNSGRIGIKSSNRCEQKNYVDGGKIKLIPKNCIELQRAVLYSSDEGKVNIYVTNAEGEKSEVLTKRLNAGRSQITGLEELFIPMQPNKIYYLHIEALKNADGHAPQLENISSCNPTVMPNENLSINYNGTHIIMDLKYAY